MNRLTGKQKIAYNFIMSYLLLNQRPPTYQEIANHMGYKNINSAQGVVGGLVKKGFIELQTGQRNIKVANAKLHIQLL